MEWILKKFEELSVYELYAILRLRNEVFAVEQQCVYPDTDNKDQESWHLMGLEGSSLLAYSRILPPGLSYEQASIGRVVNSPSARGKGLGKELMRQSIDHLYHLFGKQPVKIGAQLYLLGFYQSLGFISSGDIYLEDGIEHIEMLLS